MLVAFLGLALMIPNLVALIGWVLALTGIQGSAFPEPPTTPRKATRGFLADAAHELRTPIAGIQAAAEQQRHRQPERRTPGEVTQSPSRVSAWHRNNDVGSGGFVREFGDHR